jgi:RNA polymerase sigma-70 factor, ECF subfamily
MYENYTIYNIALTSHPFNPIIQIMSIEKGTVIDIANVPMGSSAIAVYESQPVIPSSYMEHHSVPAVSNREEVGLEVAEPSDTPVVGGNVLQYEDQLLSLMQNEFDRFIRIAVSSGAPTQQDAEDAVQKAFVRAWQSLHRFDGNNIPGYVAKITRNLAIDAWRHESRRIRNYHPVLYQDVEHELSESPSSEKSPEDQVIDASHRDELSNILDDAFGQIPEEQSNVVIAVDVLELDYAQTAELFGTPIGTTKSRVSRAKSKLRKILAEDERFHVLDLPSQFVNRVEVNSSFSHENPQEDQD